MSRYIHQPPDWPKFRWEQDALAACLADIRHRQGRLLGRMESLGFSLQKEAELETLTLDVLNYGESSASRTLVARSLSENGFCRKCTPSFMALRSVVESEE